MTLGVQPDLAIRLRESQRTLRPRLQHRDALVDVLRAVHATLEPQKVAEFLVAWAPRWMPAPSWAVAVTNGGQPTVLASRGLSGSLVPAVQSIAGWVVNSGEDFLSSDLRRDDRLPGPVPAAAALGFPLICRGRAIGGLVGLDRTPTAKPPRLTKGVAAAWQMLLEPAGVALGNALVVERTEALSVTDDLTRLFNSRYLNLSLRRETKRALRSNRPLSLLFIDLDGFKAVNDTYGHPFGSRALVEAAAVIRGCARETDVVARFGGDEFAVVLPETNREGAVFVGERVRERIAAFSFLTAEGLDVRLTASVGVATLPEAAGSAEELVQAADRAMYRVKMTGKNGISLAAD
jgi:diguanylate cyclase (GGDEF)-like protein